MRVFRASWGMSGRYCKCARTSAQSDARRALGQTAAHLDALVRPSVATVGPTGVFLLACRATGVEVKNAAVLVVSGEELDLRTCCPVQGKEPSLPLLKILFGRAWSCSLSTLA